MTETNRTPALQFESLVDVAYRILGFVKTGGSVNVTTGPYLSDVSVTPAARNTNANLIPWLIAGGAALALVVMLLED